MTSSKVMQSHPQKWLILALVLAAECMDLFDGTIVNVAAPSIRLDLNSSSSALQWIIGGYALSFAVGMVAGARLGDIYGRKRLFVIGAFGFVARVAGLRVRDRHADADLVPAGAGLRGRAADPAGPGHHPGDLLDRRARLGLRDLRPGHRTVGGARPDPRRPARRCQPLGDGLAAGLLRQPAARAGRGDRRGPAVPGIAGATGADPRPGRHRAGGRVRRPADLPADPGPRGRLAGLDVRDDGGLGRGAGRPDLLDALPDRPRPRPVGRAQHLPVAFLQRGAGDDHGVLRRHDRRDLDADAVPAARRGLLGDPRRPDPGAVRVRHGGRGRRRLGGARAQARPHRAADRLGGDGRGHLLDLAGRRLERAAHLDRAI